MAPLIEPTSTALSLPTAIGTSASALYFGNDRSHKGAAQRIQLVQQQSEIMTQAAVIEGARVNSNLYKRGQGLQEERPQQQERSQFAKRQFGNTIADWPADDRDRLLRVSDAEGNFNGTCSEQHRTLPPAANPGACTSYFPDITIYCCAGAGGQLGTVQDEEATTTTSASSSSSGATLTQEPTCRTSSYKMMLLCYKYTAETHCRSAIGGPYGLCHPNSTEWNTSVDHDENGMSTISGAGRLSLPASSSVLIAAFMAVGASTLLAASAASLS